MRMEGKVGLVTAAGSGMGRAGAIRFAKEGACVGVVDIDSDAVAAVVAEIKAAGGKALGITADLTKDEDSRRIVHEAANEFNGLDFVWNHVGHPGPAAVEDLDMKDFDQAVDLNLRTVFITMETAIPELRTRGGGSMLFTASSSGLTGSMFSPVYSMAKFGVVGMVKAMAKRYAKEGIRFNAICPGPIDTPMLRIFVARPDQQSTHGMDKEELVRTRGGMAPMGRPGEPEEIANAALFLLSDEASFITGAALPVDGGLTA
jgi:NAD(P)-dependent dehydrogenase (short-subunit alcohol dehydrogenase family)